METLEISSVIVYILPEPHGKLVALVRCCLADQIMLNGLKIYAGVRGPFVAYPMDEEKTHQVFFPVTGDLRREIERSILAEYERQKNEP